MATPDRPTRETENPNDAGVDVRLSPGDTLGGRYEIVRLIGAGGMGAVFEAKHITLGKSVGLKVMRPEVARDEKLAARFVQEARAAADVHHRHIVEMLDYGIDGERPYIVMEYLEGEPLSTLFAREGRLPIGRLVEIVDPVLRALSVAHARGIVHRDIKPENVFLSKGDDPGEVVPKILDFGVARRSGGDDVRLTATNVTLGTPAYMAPEQAMSARDVTEAADQYAVGVMLYEGVCARLPHAIDSYNGMIVAKVTTEPTPIEQVRPDLPEGFARAVMRALARNAGDRFASVNELREALAPFRSHLAPPPPAPEPTPAASVRTEVDSAAPTMVAGGSERDAMAKTATATAGSWSGNPAPAPGSSRRAALGFLPMAAAVVCVAIIAVAWYARGRPDANGSPPVIIAPAASAATPAMVHWRIHVTPSNATIRIDGELAGNGGVDIQRPADSGQHTIQLHADGFEGVAEQHAGNADLEIDRALVAESPVVAVVDAGAVPTPPPEHPTPVVHPHPTPPPPIARPNAHDPNHHIFRPTP